MPPMKLTGLLVLGAIACGVGIMMPSGGDNAAPGATTAANSAFADQTEAQMPFGRQDYLSGEMVLHQQDDGHFYASPAINSVPIDALVDTGASVIALTGADAQAIGLTWDQSQVGIVGRGASGPIEGVQVRLDRVELGSFEVHDVDAMIIPEGLHVSLLGQSFLSRIPNVAIANGEMSLSDY